MPARVEKVMPAGVMLGSSRLTTMKPLHSGRIIMMHSKQPQEVMGCSMIEYMVTVSTAPWECLAAQTR